MMDAEHKVLIQVKKELEIIIETCVEETPSDKPEPIFRKFPDIFSNNVNDMPIDTPRKDNEVDKAKIKQKISQHRQKMKKMARLGILLD